MRKIIVLSFITLDGVMQAPGRPDEDTSDGFTFGGWAAPYFAEADEVVFAFMQKYMQVSDLLLGRKTYDFFASYWPEHSDNWPGINDVTKYVVSNTTNKSPSTAIGWKDSVYIKNLDDIKNLKNSEGPDLQVHGSGNLVQTLLKHDLVDELWLKTFPITLGTGKRLFGEGTIPAAFILTDSLVTPNGTFFANYTRAGEVKTGIIGS